MSDVLDSIDATLSERCACGCDRPLDPAGPSAWFATADCQWTWQNAAATHPNDVYNRPDAAVYPLDDSADIPLSGGREAAYAARLADELDRLAERRPTAALMWDRRPSVRPPAIVTDTRDPIIAAPGVPAGLRYRRWCERCRAACEPVAGLLPRLPLIIRTFSESPLRALEPLPVDRAHMCGTCLTAFPAPALWARLGIENNVCVRGLTDAPSEGRYLTMRFDRTMVDHQWSDSVAALAEVAWRDLEYELAELRRPMCCVPQCEAKARETYVVQHRPGWPDLRLCGRSWRPDDRIEVCPEHSYLILRGEDPANPGPVLDELTFPLIGMQLAEARHG